MENVDEKQDYKQEIIQLNNRIEELEALAKKQNERIKELEALVKYYEEQLRLKVKKQFGPSSEKTKNQEETQGVFNEVEDESNKKVKEPSLEDITQKGKKRVGKREEDLASLPVVEIEYKLPEDEMVCPECGGPLHQMSKEIRREIDIIPAQVRIINHVQYIYSCRACENNGISVPIIKASAGESLIKGSLASPSSVAHVMVQKYVNAVPLYRIEQGLLSDGIELSRQTMANWLLKSTEDYLSPLYECMKEELIKRNVLHADETEVQVLHEEGRKATTNSYMWLYRTSGDTNHPIVLYEYQPTRSSSHPKNFLDGFQGFLHTDGYSGYHNLSEVIIIVGCWSHLRRYFHDALKAMPEGTQSGSNAEKGIDFCNQLFKLERDFEGLTFQERYTKRLEQSKPIADSFFSWINSIKDNVLPKSALGKAVTYAINQKVYLENVFLDGRLELSNNRAERSMKVFVIGRNYVLNKIMCSEEQKPIIFPFPLIKMSTLVNTL